MGRGFLLGFLVPGLGTLIAIGYVVLAFTFGEGTTAGVGDALLWIGLLLFLGAPLAVGGVALRRSHEGPAAARAASEGPTALSRQGNGAGGEANRRYVRGLKAGMIIFPLLALIIFGAFLVLAIEALRAFT